MAWFLTIVLTVVLLALLVGLVLAELLGDTTENERTRIEMEVRRAERRLHDLASSSFQAMLDEARARGGVGRSR
jgi:hypothetical protein